MATYTTYEQVGIKEDISDVISNISPTKTPFQTAIGNEKITQTLFQWQEDSLRAVAANAQVEGSDASDVTTNPTVMRNNTTQILTETVKVSDTNNVVSAYGRAKEMAYQMAKSSAQLKRDLENAFVGTQQTKVVGSATVARKMAGVQAQIDSSAVTYTGAGPAPLTESVLLSNLQACYSNGADPSRVHVTPSDSLVVAAFAAAAGRYRTFNGESAKAITNVVNLYVSPFGEQKIEINRFQNANDTIVFDPAMWSKATLRSWTREALAKTGDASRQMIVGEFSLKHKNYKASGLIVKGTAGL
jgi:hypothetical protein